MRFFSKKTIVVTHNGGFHPDDVFSVAALSILHNGKIYIERTRDKEKIKKADYVVDVGGIYDAEKNLFDHHQIGGAGERQNGVPYASFGLVWRKYGELICGDKEVAVLMDKILAQYIDVMDNGVGDLKPVFSDVTPFTIVEVIMNIRPVGNLKKRDFDEYFFQAVEIAKRVLVDGIKIAKSEIRVKKIIEEIYKKSEDKRLIIFDDVYSWFDILKNYSEPLFVIEPEHGALGEEADWKVKCVRDNPNNFINRKDLPADWAGKRDQELAEVTGVKDAVFCHNKRFMVVTKSKESAIKLAKIALAN